MKRILACAAAAATMVCGSVAYAEGADPLADLIGTIAAKVEPLLKPFALVATLYHGGHGMRDRDASGCRVVPMRTAAVDGVAVRRHTLLFIKETVGLKMPDGRLHDGYWYASDTGGSIREGRIDLFTGSASSSMAPLMHLNRSQLTVAAVGEFTGCPVA